MLRRVFVIVALVCAAVAGVSGQTRTVADGVAALARGDYQRAVEILRPIAEDPWSENSVARFFMAGLYESGNGVPMDPLRACALYLRATSNHDNPFGQEAEKLFVATVSRGKEFNEECNALANIGFDSGFEPVTFDLGPGHWVEWKLSAATVTYDGRTKRVEMPFFMSPGARIRPLKHTELATGPARAVSRHFLEAFAWLPAGRSGPWKLQWFLFEVVRDEIVTIEVSDSLSTADGDAPPPPESLDPRDYAVVRVTDEGDAEWAVLKGPRRMARRIETDAERRAVREERAARDAALKAVDFKARPDVSRQPTMSYTGADGCGDIQVYGWSSDRAEAVVARIDRPALNISTQPATLDLSQHSASISVQAYVFDRPQPQFSFCSDVGMAIGPGSVGPEVWRAVAGTITIELSPPGSRARGPSATIMLSNAVLRNSAGTTVRIARPVRLTAVVGGVAG